MPNYSTFTHNLRYLTRTTNIIPVNKLKHESQSIVEQEQPVPDPALELSHAVHNVALVHGHRPSRLGQHLHAPLRQEGDAAAAVLVVAVEAELQGPPGDVGVELDVLPVGLAPAQDELAVVGLEEGRQSVVEPLVRQLDQFLFGELDLQVLGFGGLGQLAVLAVCKLHQSFAMVLYVLQQFDREAGIRIAPKIGDDLVNFIGPRHFQRRDQKLSAFGIVMSGELSNASCQPFLHD